MRITFSSRAYKQFFRLPSTLQKKVWKQLDLLFIDRKHPSLRLKKMAGVDAWELRIDYRHRLVFEEQNDEIHILSLGPHDVGLGKK